MKTVIAGICDWKQNGMIGDHHNEHYDGYHHHHHRPTDVLHHRHDDNPLAVPKQKPN